MSAGAEDTHAHSAPDRPTTSPEASAPASARWLARAAFLAALAAAVVLVGFALNGGTGAESLRIPSAPWPHPRTGVGGAPGTLVRPGPPGSTFIRRG